MAELKAGCIALVIFSENESEIGRCVEVIESVAKGYSFNFPGCGKHSWNENNPAWLVKGDVSIFTNKQSGGFSYFLSTELMPIDGEDFSEDLVSERGLSHA